MTPEEKAHLLLEAGDGQEADSHPLPATAAPPAQALSLARYALRAACVAVGLCSGRRSEEVAAEIARRAVAVLLAKPEATASGAKQ